MLEKFTPEQAAEMVARSRATLSRPPFTSGREAREDCRSTPTNDDPPVLPPFERRGDRMRRRLDEFHAGLERERRQNEREEKRERQQRQHRNAQAQAGWDQWCDGRIAHALDADRRSTVEAIAEQFAKLKARIARLETELEETRKAVNADNAKIVDLPNLLHRRTTG
jgi:hypothetical protein